MSNFIITSACDANFLWGAYLLVGSLRQNGVRAPIIIAVKGMTKEQEALLTQFPDVTLIPNPLKQRSTVAIKPVVLLEALSRGAEWAVWFDADCMAIGAMEDLIIPKEVGLQIRLRKPNEMAPIYRARYESGEPEGGVAKRVLQQWCRDVGDLSEPQQTRTGVANALVFHRSHRAFIELWAQQMAKVLPSEPGVVQEDLVAYHMTDESVINSLLFFSSLAPKVTEFKLDLKRSRHLAHFGGKIKPWMAWAGRNTYCYPYIRKLIRWSRSRGYNVPPIPPSFSRWNWIKIPVISGLEHAKLAVKLLLWIMRLRQRPVF